MTTITIGVENDVFFTPAFKFSGTLVGGVYEVYQPPLDGRIAFEGGTIKALIPQAQPVYPLAGAIGFHGKLGVTLNLPHAAFKDFAHYPYGGTDPAMALITNTSGGLTSAAAGSYNRQYVIVTGPQDYPVSGGGYAWKKAAYASVGFKFASMNANTSQLLDAVQLEEAPLGTTGPSTYSLARQIQVIVKPTRLNYCTNPSMVTGITGYTATNSATVAAGSVAWQGNTSLQVTVPAGATQNSGFSYQVTGLIPGKTYTMSAKVALATGCGDVVAWSGVSGTTFLGTTTWLKATPDPTNQRFRTLSVTFTAKSSSAYVGMEVLVNTTVPGTASMFWADAVLIEEGSSARPYFDGNFGADYLWESGGSANASRSYYYENRVERSYLVQTLLNENVPLGISSAVPLYAVLPTQ